MSITSVNEPIKWFSRTCDTDGKKLATTSSDNSIQIHEVSSGKMLREIPTGKLPARCPCFTSKGTKLITASGRYRPGGIIQTWNVTTGKRLREITLPGDQVLTPFAFSVDGSLLALEGRATKREKNPVEESLFPQSIASISGTYRRGKKDFGFRVSGT